VIKYSSIGFLTYAPIVTGLDVQALGGANSMGFCSGTDIFEPVAKVVLESQWSDEIKYTVIRELVDALENHDWDCQDESEYWQHPIVRRVFKDLHPDWDFLFEEDGI
jgi:hypothetical protein